MFSGLVFAYWRHRGGLVVSRDLHHADKFFVLELNPLQVPRIEVLEELVQVGFILIFRQEDAQHDDCEHRDEADLEDVQAGFSRRRVRLLGLQTGVFLFVVLFCHFFTRDLQKCRGILPL